MIIGKIISEGIQGAMMIGAGSYFISRYRDNPNYVKIISYSTFVPIGLSYLVWLCLQKSEISAINFLKHFLIGIALTILACIITILTHKYSSRWLAFNWLVLVILTCGYFYYEIYDKI
jgi:hypothetical protein